MTVTEEFLVEVDTVFVEEWINGGKLKGVMDRLYRDYLLYNHGNYVTIFIDVDAYAFEGDLVKEVNYYKLIEYVVAYMLLDEGYNNLTDKEVASVTEYVFNTTIEVGNLEDIDKESFNDLTYWSGGEDCLQLIDKLSK